MNNNLLHEQLSALVDGECRNEEISLLTKRLLADETLKTKWTNYHLIQSALAQHLPDQIAPSFSQGVMARIADEVAQNPVPSRPVSHSWQWSAVAALLFVVGGAGLSVFYSEKQTVQVAESWSQATSVVEQDPMRNPVLRSYLVTHMGYANNNPMSGAMPFVRVVGFSADNP